jgi:hypothetical protein
MSWFLESWSVADGCGFAAYRNYSDGGAGGRDYHDPPQQVIYLCAPHFTPTPAGYATALSAARGRFQEKFFDDHGTEVAFETLDQLIELVRRAYLAAGAGSNPPPDPTAPLGPEPNSPRLDDHESSKWREAIRRLRSAQTTDERSDAAKYIDSIWSDGATTSLVHFCSLVVAAMAKETGSRNSGVHRERDRRDFLLLALEMNDWPHADDAALFVSRAFSLFGARPSYPYWGPPAYHGWYGPLARTDGLSRALSGGLLKALPAPYSWKPYDRLARLGDHLAAGLADRGYLESVTSFEQLLPLLACALALAAAESHRFQGGALFCDASVVRRRAFDWLARSVPGDELDRIPVAISAVRQVIDAATTARNTL